MKLHSFAPESDSRPQRRKPLLFLLTLIFSTGRLWAQQPVTEPASLDHLVRSAIAANQDLASVRQRIDEAQGLLRQAGVRPAPTLDLTGSTGAPLGTEGEDQYGASYLLPVETFGKRGKRIRVAESAVRLAQADFRTRAAELTYSVKTAYAELVAERHKAKLLSDLVAFNEQALQLTEQRVKEGDVAPLESGLLKAEVSQAKISLITAKNRAASAELQLRQLTGLSESTPIADSDIPSSSLPDLKELQQTALQRRPDIESARIAARQQEEQVELAKANGKPDVTVSAGYSKQGTQIDGVFGLTSTGIQTPIRDQSNLLTFGVSIALRTPRSERGDVEAAAARSSGARLHEQYLERTIPLEVKSAYERWQAASESVQMFQSGVLEPSTSNLSIMRQAYTLGQLRLLDVLVEQRRVIDAQLSGIDAQADVARSLAELERAVGGNLP